MLSIGWISWRKMLMYIKAEASYKKSQEEVPQHCMDFWWIVYKDRTHVEFHGIIVHWNYFPLFIIWIVNTSIYLWGLSLLLRWGISTHLPTNVCLFATCKYTQWMWRCNGQYCLPSNSSTHFVRSTLSCPGPLLLLPCQVNVWPSSATWMSMDNNTQSPLFPCQSLIIIPITS